MNTSPRIAMSSHRRTPAQPGSAVNTSPFGAKCTAQLEDPELIFTSFDRAKIAYVPPSVSLNLSHCNTCHTLREAVGGRSS